MIGSCLVTGGAGFIGSHTCKELRRAGIVPVAFDNLSEGHRDAVRWGPLIEGDVRHKASLIEAIERHRPEFVMHFAASAYVGASGVDPASYYDNNVLGLHALLEAMRASGLDKIIFSSSCAIYGSTSGPIDEDTPRQPINVYGRTKLIGEQMLADYASAYGIKYAALRYFNAAGADVDRELAERHEPEPHLIPRALLAAAGRLPPLDIYGNDYPTPDGTCVRDYVHVSDLARAHVLAAAYLRDGGESLSVNLGAGIGFSVLEIVSAAGTTMGRPVPVVLRGRRAGDPPTLLADISRARARLGFEPRLSTIAGIVRTAALGLGLEIAHG